MPFIRPVVRTSGTIGEFALKFPNNSSASNTTDPYAVIEFANPQSNGLGMWGASNTSGVTVIRKVNTVAHAGYYAQFWYSRADGTINPAVDPYWGMHPYPDPPSTSSTHVHEVATDGLDIVNSSGQDWNLAGSNKTSVSHGTTYLQGMRVTRTSANSKTLRYYFNLPNVDSANYVEYTVTTANYGETDIANSPKVTIGDSPWYAAFQHERFGGTLDAIKIFNSVLSEADMLTEAQNLSTIPTSAGQSAIWWGRNGFDTGHATNTGSILCHFGTGRSFTIVNPSADVNHQISLVARL